MSNKILNSVLAFAGDDAALTAAVSQDVETAAARIILSNDSALIVDTVKALDGRKGAKAKEISAALSAAMNNAGLIRAGLINDELLPKVAPKGGHSSDVRKLAAERAIPVAVAFLAACAAAAEARKAAAAATRAANKAKKEAAPVESKDAGAAPAPLKVDRIRTAQRIRAMRAEIRALRAELDAARGLVPTDAPVKRRKPAEVKEAIAA